MEVEAEPASEMVACYRRAAVSVPSCKYSPGATLRQYDRAAKAWSMTARTNCYPGAGGSCVPPATPTYPCTGAAEPVPLEECLAACANASGCDAVVTLPQQRPGGPTMATCVLLLLRAVLVVAVLMLLLVLLVLLVLGFLLWLLVLLLPLLSLLLSSISPRSQVHGGDGPWVPRAPRVRGGALHSARSER